MASEPEQVHPHQAHPHHPGRDVTSGPPLPFRSRVIYTIAVIATAAVALVLLWMLRWVFCLAFLAVLFAVFLRGGADVLAFALGPRVRLKEGTALGLFCLLLVLMVTAFIFFAVPSLSRQVGQLRAQLPQSLERIENELRRSRWGTWLVEEGTAMVEQVRPDSRPAPATASSTQAAAGPEPQQQRDQDRPALGMIFRQAAGWFSSAITAVIALLFVVFAGLYIAAEPGLYTRGILWLVPPRGRKKADCVLKRVGRTLRFWLMGQLVAMTIVGLLAGLGLWILGAPLPLVMGALAAVAEFVPNVGPFIAASLPTVMAATSEGRFLDGPSLAVAVLLLFLFIQTLESYLITPMIQRRAVELPPALLIVTQLSAAFVLGPLGVVIAAPLVASAMAVLRELVVVGDVEREHPKDRAHD